MAVRTEVTLYHNFKALSSLFAKISVCGLIKNANAPERKSATINKKMYPPPRSVPYLPSPFPCSVPTLRPELCPMIHPGLCPVLRPVLYPYFVPDSTHIPPRTPLIFRPGLCPMIHSVLHSYSAPDSAHDPPRTLPPPLSSGFAPYAAFRRALGRTQRSPGLCGTRFFPVPWPSCDLTAAPVIFRRTSPLPRKP